MMMVYYTQSMVFPHTPSMHIADTTYYDDERYVMAYITTTIYYATCIMYRTVDYAITIRL